MVILINGFPAQTHLNVERDEGIMFGITIPSFLDLTHLMSIMAEINQNPVTPVDDTTLAFRISISMPISRSHIHIPMSISKRVKNKSKNKIKEMNLR